MVTKGTPQNMSKGDKTEHQKMPYLLTTKFTSMVVKCKRAATNIFNQFSDHNPNNNKSYKIHSLILINK